MNRLEKYNSFLESIFGFGKKEISYFYSTRFRTILKAIAESGDSIAQSLVYAEDVTKISDDITFIDIGSSESVVSFIQLNRLSKIAELENDNNTSSKIEGIIRNRWRQSMDDLSSNGWTDQRTEISVGRFVNRVFQKAKFTTSSEQVEKFVNLYKSRIKMASNIDDVFEIVNGEDIRKWYLGDNYISGRGQLSNSCMRYRTCQEYLDIYVKNTDVCQLLIMKDDNNKLLGRALIWKLTDGSYYMDRQYSNTDADIELYREYARKNGWSYHGDRSRSTKELTVQLGKHDYDYFPYMDSFVVYNYKTNILSTYEEHWGSQNGWWKLQDTKGGHTSDRVVYSDYNDEWIPMDDAVYCEDISDWVRQDQAIYVEYKDRWYSSDSDLVCWSDYFAEYLLIDDAIFSDYMQDWLRSEDTIICYISSTEEIEIPSDKNDITKEVNIDGVKKLCLTNSIMLDPFTDKWVFKKDKVKLYYCKEKDMYLCEDDINELEVDRNNTILEAQSNYIISKIGILDMGDQRTLIEYLHNLKLTDNIKEKIEKYFPPRSYESVDISFQLIKLAIILQTSDSNRNDYFKQRIRNGYDDLETNSTIFLEFIDRDTYSNLSISNWYNYLSFADKFLYEIITDKDILKIYMALKFIQKS